MIAIICDLDEGDSRSHGSGDRNAGGTYSRKREACPERDAARVHCACGLRERNQVWTGLKIVVVNELVGSRGGRQSRPTSRTPEIKCSESPLPEQRFSSRPRLSVTSPRENYENHARKLTHFTPCRAKASFRRSIRISFRCTLILHRHKEINYSHCKFN